MNDAEIKFLGDVQKLTVAPDDILVISCERMLSDAECADISSFIQQQLPNQMVWVLTGGVKVGVLSKDGL